MEILQVLSCEMQVEEYHCENIRLLATTGVKKDLLPEQLFPE
jgi:hypothetical protein